MKFSFCLKASLLAFVVLFIYSFSIDAPFKMDDRQSILLNPLIKDWAHVSELLTRGYGDQSYYRPLVYLSYSWEHHLLGGQSFVYHFDNNLIHIVNVFLVWMLVSLLWSLWCVGKSELNHRQNSQSHWDCGFWVALLFAVHPVHWEAVANISGRAVLLCTMFSLMSFYAFIRAFQAEQAGWLAASLIAFVLALLSQESAGVWPGVFLAFVFLTRSSKMPWKKTAVYLTPFVAVIAGYVVLRRMIGVDHVYWWLSWQDCFLGFLTFLRSLVTHLRLLVWPVGLYFDRSQALYPSLDHPEVLYVSALWILIGVQLWVFRRYFRPLDVFCLIWMTLGFLPVSQIPAVVAASPGYISSADHFLYTPSIPFFILLVRILTAVQSLTFLKMYISRWSMRIVVFAFLIFLTAMNVQQNFYARDESLMLERSLAYQPYNSRLQSVAGYLALTDEDYRSAERHFAQAVEIDPMNPSSRISLGGALCGQRRIGECLIQYMTVNNAGSFEEVLEESIQYPVGILQERIAQGRKLSQSDWFGWSLYQAQSGQWPEAISAINNVLQLNPENVSALVTLASFYEFNGNILKARDCYSRLMNINDLPGSTFDYVMARLADLRIHYPQSFGASS